ncbi:MAG: proteasome assembly chaperone family protein [Candidatus Aenigmatarchaeota archaeon]
METIIIPIEKVKMNNPILIEGLPGIGNVGRVAAGYLINELGMKKIAELYSRHFWPLVVLHPDSTVTPLKNEFYHHKGEKNDIIIFTGDTQSVTPDGHYEICEKVLEFCQTNGIKMIITLGGFAEGKELTEPKIIGAVNDKKLVEKYKDFGIDFGKDHPTGTIIGASGLLIGMARLKNIDAICLMGQTVGMPGLTDPKAADNILHTLSKILNLKLDLTKLEKAIEEIDEQLKKAEKIQKQVNQHSKPSKEETRYIG